MNTFDVIVIAVLAFAAYKGAKDGLVVQGFSIVGILLGIWMGLALGESVAKMVGIDGAQREVWGFVIVFFIMLIVVALAARIIRGLLKAVGLGVVDVVAGGALSVCKYLIIMSFAFTAFESVNGSLGLVENKTLNKSALFMPIANLSSRATSAWDSIQDSLDVSVKDIKSIDIKDLDPSKIDLSKIDLSKIDLSDIDLSKIDLSDIDVDLDTDDLQKEVEKRIKQERRKMEKELKKQSK